MSSGLSTDSPDNAFSSSFYGGDENRNASLADLTGSVDKVWSAAEKPWPLLKHPVYVVTLLTIAYTLVAGLGIVNNTLIVVVVTTQSALRSVTNCFLANLAVADIVVCIVVLPITLLENIFTEWMQGAALCKVIPYLQGVAVGASVNTLVAVAFERYQAIFRPHARRCHSGPSIGLVLVGIWAVPAVLFIPWLCVYRLQTRTYHIPIMTKSLSSSSSSNNNNNCSNVELIDTSTTIFGLQSDVIYSTIAKESRPAETVPVQFVYCSADWPSLELHRIFTVSAVSVTCYLAPLACIAFFYARIGWRVWKRRGAGQLVAGEGTAAKNIRRSKARLLRMLATVVCLFAVSWLPLYVVNLYLLFLPPPGDPEAVARRRDLQRQLKYVFPVAQWLGASNSCTNTFVYCYYSRSFRDAVLRVLRFDRSGPGAGASVTHNSVTRRRYLENRSRVAASRATTNVVNPEQRRPTSARTEGASDAVARRRLREWASNHGLGWLTGSQRPRGVVAVIVAAASDSDRPSDQSDGDHVAMDGVEMLVMKDIPSTSAVRSSAVNSLFP